MRKIVLAVIVILFVAGSFIVLSNRNNEGFRLVENIEPQIFPLVDQGEPGWVAPNTLQALPAGIRQEAERGGEVAPLRIRNTFDAPLRISLRLRGDGPITFSKTDWKQPPLTVQEIGIRQQTGAPLQDIIEIRALLPSRYALQEKSRQRKTVFTPEIRLQVPIVLTAESSPNGLLFAPRLESAGNQFQPQVTVSNTSLQPLLARGEFILKSNAKTYSQPFAPGQTVLPGETTALFVQRPWENLRPGAYQLRARLVWGQREQSTGRNVIISSSGATANNNPWDVAIGLEAQEDRLEVQLQNNGSQLPATTLRLYSSGDLQFSQGIPLLESGKTYTVSLPSDLQDWRASLWLKGKNIAKSSIKELPASENRNWLLLAVLPVVIFIIILIQRHRASSAEETKNNLRRRVRRRSYQRRSYQRRSYQRRSYQRRRSSWGNKDRRIRGRRGKRAVSRRPRGIDHRRR